MQFDDIQYEVAGGVAVITLDRPEAANAQSAGLLAQLDQAWRSAADDPAVKVIVLQSNGKHFSAGHDMTGGEGDIDYSTVEAHYDWELRHYLHYAKSWRDVPKPSIAAVQGKCIAAGLMLCWPCDLIVASENAEFSDPVLHMGICSVEFLGHPWELGPRKAKELLFTGGSISASEASQLGMVNQVVPLEELRSATMELANRIAGVDSFALRMAKRAINHTMDVQGFTTAIDAAYDIHHLGHARARQVTGGIPSLVDLDAMKTRGRDAK